jgi:hypothetical protein
MRSAALLLVAAATVTLASGRDAAIGVAQLDEAAVTAKVASLAPTDALFVRFYLNG